MKTLLAFLIIFIIFEIPISIGMGLIFKKMKLDFKKGIIPFYNKIILIKKYKLEQYHLILIFIPIAGLYTNFIIYNKICKKYNKNKIYVIELTLLPFIYNIFLGLELNENNEQIENYFEDQKNIYEQDEPDLEIKQEEYTWKPKKILKSNNIYKASRNNISAKVNININKKDEIIDNKKDKYEDEKDTKICPKCGAKMKKNAEICFLCGTKL